MDEKRRTFLKGSLFTLGLTALPGPLKTAARTLSPRWAPTVLRVSTPALRGTSPAIAAITARAAAARAWIAAAGGAACVALKKFSRTGTLPFWFDPRFRPSLHSPITGQLRC